MICIDALNILDSAHLNYGTIKACESMLLSIFSNMLEEIQTPSEPKPTSTYPHMKFLAIVVLVSICAGFFGGYFGALRAGQVHLAANNSTAASSKPVVITEQSAVIDVVKKANPAVVSIVISKDLSKIPGFGTDPFSNDPFYQLFGFNRQTPRSGPTPNVQKIGAGSGFLVSADGLILTNKHVVEDENASYTVLTNDRKKYEAKVLSRDPVNDLAILKISITNAPTLELADSSQIQIGQRVIAIGNSLGQYDNTVTTGVVSAINRSVTAGGGSGAAEQLEGVIQTDAAINPGNSGGPLLNVLGQVIGINTAIDQEGQLVGFAIPANDISHALDSFKKTGGITRPYIGVRYVLITADLAQSQKLPKDHGALITRGETVSDMAVIPGSPADKAGLVENDIILSVEGVPIDEDHSLSSLLRNRQIGDVVNMQVYHKGEEKTVRVTLSESK